MTRFKSLTFVFALGVAACAAQSSAESTAQADNVVHPIRKAKPSDDVIRKELTPLQYNVTQHEGTEEPFHNAYYDNHAPGLYVDIVTGEPLFTSNEKFDSGTGWPSFWKPIDKNAVIENHDDSAGMERVEVKSKIGGSHLGHVFDDGPKPTGLRYCMNSASLRFIPVDRLEVDGYGQYRSLFATAKK